MKVIMINGPMGVGKTAVGKSTFARDCRDKTGLLQI